MILGISGKLSGGKTCTAVKYAYDQGLQGKKVLSNIRLNLPSNIRQTYIRDTEFIHFLKTNYDNPDQIKKVFHNSVFLVDEIVNLVSARKSSSGLNELITNFFMMCGKLSCDVVFTAQDLESMADKRLRSVCNVYANCFRISETNTSLIDQDRIVKGKVLIVVYFLFDLDILGKIIKQMVYDPSPYFSMYDTEEIVLLDRSKYLRGGTRDLRKW